MSNTVGDYTVTVSGTTNDDRAFEIDSAVGDDPNVTIDPDGTARSVTVTLPAELIEAIAAEDGPPAVTAVAAATSTKAETETTIVIEGGLTVLASNTEDFTATVVTDSTDQPNGVTSVEVKVIDADALSSQDAGAGVSVRIEFSIDEASAIAAGDDVVIEMKGFQLPSDIDPDSISITDGVNTANAADASASSTKITIEIPDMNDDGTGSIGLPGNVDTGEGINTDVTIRVRSRAGVKNPTMAGDGYSIKVTHEGDTRYERSPGAIIATLKVAPESGIADAELTVSGVGYSNGTATIYLVAGDEVPAAGSFDTTPDDFKSVGSAIVSKGSFSTSVTVGDKFEAGANDLIARSSTGKWGPDDDFKLNGAISLPDSVTKGTDLTVKVSKWSAGPILSATINGEDMYTVGTDGTVDMVGEGDAAVPTFKEQEADEDDKAEFKIRVGAKALLGEQTLILWIDDPDEDDASFQRSAGQKNIEVIGIELTVSPSTAVVGQEVTVTGSGFRYGNQEKIMELMVDIVNVIGQVDDPDRGVASGGRVVAAFNIPDHEALADAGEYTITLSDGERTGSATLTIAEPTLTVDPAEGRIGTPRRPQRHWLAHRIRR